MAKATGHDDCPFTGMLQPVQQDPKIEVRVGKLEGAVETLAKDMSDMARNITGLGTEIGNLRSTLADKIDTMGQRMADKTKPNMQAITLFVTIGLAVLGMAGSLAGVVMNNHSSQIAELKAGLDTARAQHERAQYEKGQSDAFVKMAEQRMIENAAKFRDLDDKLQREMALINNTTESKVKALDDKLQLEFNGLHKAIDVQVQAQAEQVTELRKWRLEHVQGNAELHGKIDIHLQDMSTRLKQAEDRQWDYRQDRLKAFEAANIQRDEPAQRTK